jgi:hypothetical protein
METNNQPQDKQKYDYGTLLFMAVLLMTISQAIESIQTPVGRFIRGVVVGMSIVCSLTGLVLYVRSQRKG